MTGGDDHLHSVGIISELVKIAPKRLGRTALMKCLFFLKTLKKVPLPYSFRLYTYGPFDSDVLDDLRYAESLGAIESTVIPYPGGYGYEFRRGQKAEEIDELTSDYVSRYRDSIDWVIGEFGDRTASNLEMASTLVYVDREFSEKGTKVSIAELAEKVHNIKHHLTTDSIEKEARNLKESDFLHAVS